MRWKSIRNRFFTCDDEEVEKNFQGSSAAILLEAKQNSVMKLKIEYFFPDQLFSFNLCGRFSSSLNEIFWELFWFLKTY